MANRFWVGGSGTWDATAGTKWALTSGGAGGQTVPTYIDDVYFDANSNVALTSWTVTLGTAPTCANFNVINPDGQMTLNRGTLGANTLTVYGTWNVVTTNTYFVLSGTGQVKFTIGTQTTISTLLTSVGSKITFGGNLPAATPIPIIEVPAYSKMNYNVSFPEPSIPAITSNIGFVDKTIDKGFLNPDKEDYNEIFGSSKSNTITPLPYQFWG